MNITQIMVSSNSNPDWNGTWHKKDVRDEMAEIELDVQEDNWIEYVLDMALDAECPDSVIHAFIDCQEIKSIELNLPSGDVKIMKF